MKRNFLQAIQAELSIWRVGALPGLLVIGLVVFLRVTGSLQPLEWWTLDYLLRSRPSELSDKRILIVGIDEQDIHNAKAYPIPDHQLAALLAKLQTHQPRAIGLDIIRDMAVEPGHAALSQQLSSSKNIIGIEKALPDDRGNIIQAPSALPPEQIGFADIIADQDGALRRSLLGTWTANGDYKFSLAILLAQHYLEAAGYRLENGTQDPAAMRFGTTELARFLSNSGAYVNADANGNQILLNYRSGKEPFHRVSMTDVMQGEVPEDWIRDRIILIGMTSPTTGDLVNSNAVNGSLFGAIYGVEYHAHAISQILAAVLDRRPLLRTWGDGWEYIWIIGWGIWGILLGRFLLSPPKVLLGLAFSSLVLVAVGYGLLLLGWWIPLAPALMVLVLNGAGLTAALFYRHQQDLEERIQDRQMVIEQTFDAIHNGPLQTLAKMLRDVHDQQVSRTQLGQELMQLNQELRAVYTAVQQETLAQGNPLHICGDSSLNLQHPLSELLHSVYRATLARDFPCFQTLKIKVVSFEEMNDRPLSIEQKRGLCRFLEEALCNAGKYAKGMTRLEVICKSQQGRNVIYVAENGQGMQRSGRIGRGTQQAKQLARQLGGTFRRVDRSPQGTICELSYPVQRLRFWWR